VGAHHLHALVLPVLGFLSGVCILQARAYLKTGAWVLLPKYLRLSGSLLMALMIVLWAARFAGAFGGPVAVHKGLSELRRN
jgi:hypothetical protein